MSWFKLSEPTELAAPAETSKSKTERASQYESCTRLTTIVGVGYDVVGVLAGTFVGYVANSVDAYNFAIVCAVDVISSLLAVWRFSSPETSAALLEERENRATVGMLLSFVALGVTIILTNTYGLVEDLDDVNEALSMVWTPRTPTRIPSGAPCFAHPVARRCR